MNLTMRGISMEIDDGVIVEMVRQRLVGSAYPDNLKLTAAPRIGAVWVGQDGTYAGMARGLDGKLDYPLIVGPEAPERLNWAQARDFAADHKGWRLMLRHEAWLCKANVPELFKHEYYWTGEQYEGDADYAWAQYFGLGSQVNYHKSYVCRVRLVRSVIVID